MTNKEVIASLVFSHADQATVTRHISTVTFQQLEDAHERVFSKSSSQLATEKYYNKLLATPIAKRMADWREQAKQDEINLRGVPYSPDPNCTILMFGVDYKRARKATIQEKIEFGWVKAEELENNAVILDSVTEPAIITQSSTIAIQTVSPIAVQPKKPYYNSKYRNRQRNRNKNLVVSSAQ